MESRTFYEMLAYIFQNRDVFRITPMATLGSMKLEVAESISKVENRDEEGGMTE